MALAITACGGDGDSDVSTDLATKPVPALPDGDVDSLLVTDVVVGDGDAAVPGDRVSVQYVGALAGDGAEFDASWDRGVPFEFVLGEGNVIAGWDEGVEGMQVGGRRLLTIPSELGYSDRGTPDGSIPPGADLVFVVDLLEVTSLADEVSALFDDARSRPTTPTVDGRITELSTETLIAGSGDAARTGDQVEVHYVGALTDGEEFDASWDRGAPSFPVVLGIGEVLEGWDLGLVGVQTGERRVLNIPAASAYGAEGTGPIGPDQDLVFVVDVVSVWQPADVSDQPTAVLPDGDPGQLEITELRSGSGAEVMLGDSAMLHAALIVVSTGEEIDSTWERGFPVPIQAGGGRPFPGFDQVLLGMQAGGQRQAFVPPNLAYGEAGAPPSVGPNEAILVIIEVVEIT